MLINQSNRSNSGLLFGIKVVLFCLTHRSETYRYIDPFYSDGRYQRMGAFPQCFRYALALLKCRQPKKPRYADRGEG